MKFTDKKVADIRWTNWGEESDPGSNHSLLVQHAPVQHLDDCQFTMYCQFAGEEQVVGWRAFGFSEDLIDAMVAANKAGYHWLCFSS